MGGRLSCSCDPGIEIGYAIQGCCNGLGSGEGFILLKATGAGRLVLNSYGSIIRYDLAPGVTPLCLLTTRNSPRHLQASLWDFAPDTSI
jgi:hypothetical protein